MNGWPTTSLPGILHRRLHVGRLDAGGRGADQRLLRRVGIDLGQHLVLQLQAFRHALLDEVSARDRFRDGLGKGQLAFLRQAARHHLLVGAARALHHLVDLAGRLRVRIEDRDVDAVEQKARDPAGADDPSADGGCFADCGHTRLTSASGA